jgi:hypothetical protein
MRTASVLLAACMTAGLSGSGFANDLKAETNFRDTIVGFKLKESYSDVSLSISGPHHLHANAHARGAAPSVDLRQFGRPEDGLYHYQLNAATNEAVRSNTKHDNGRGDRERGEMRRGVATSGVFWVKNGAIVQHDRNAREETKRPQ